MEQTGRGGVGLCSALSLEGGAARVLAWLLWMGAGRSAGRFKEGAGDLDGRARKKGPRESWLEISASFYCAG